VQSLPRFGSPGALSAAGGLGAGVFV